MNWLAGNWNTAADIVHATGIKDLQLTMRVCRDAVDAGDAVHCPPVGLIPDRWAFLPGKWADAVAQIQAMAAVRALEDAARGQSPAVPHDDVLLAVSLAMPAAWRRRG